MTWKIYAGVSGATVLAGWLASAPPSNTLDSATPRPRQAAARQPTHFDIEREAMRLQARVRREAVYTEPQRNPFRFGATGPLASAGVRDAAPRDEPLIPEVPPSPPVSLSGIAEDQVEQRVERTAILSSPAGVLLVHEGDDVLGQYRVAKIESEAVELVTLADGTTLRLALKP